MSSDDDSESDGEKEEHQHTSLTGEAFKMGPITEGRGRLVAAEV